MSALSRGELAAAAHCRDRSQCRPLRLPPYTRGRDWVHGRREPGCRDVAIGISATNGQPWCRWCSQCDGLAFWDGSREPGRCIAGNRHDHSGSSNYSLPHNTTFSGGQPGWRWCSQCEGLIFQTATPSPCPAGGPHKLGGSADYALRNGGTDPTEQPNWRWCNKCQILAYFDGSRQPGPCPVNGRHDHTGSGNYSIPNAAWTASLVPHRTSSWLRSVSQTPHGRRGMPKQHAVRSTDDQRADLTARFAGPLKPAPAGV